MRRNICTLFDKNYLLRGLAFYHSLCRHCPQFTLWMLCMDEGSYEMLQKLNLENVILLKLSEVEDTRLKEVKPTRTSTEYCWMFSSSLPLYILEKNKNLDMISYIDADIYFYDSIENIYNEFGNNSIMIIPHNYDKKNKQREKTSGKYNVGMMIFRNDENGLECLRWWKDRVIEWCYDRYEDGKFGDQLYLDNWPEKFKKVYILKNLGVNVAPWNIGNLNFITDGEKIICIGKKTKEKSSLIFYHFHGLKIYLNRNKKIKVYPIVILNYNIYNQYIETLKKCLDEINIVDKNWNFGFTIRLSILKRIKQKLQRGLLDLLETIR